MIGKAWRRIRSSWLLSFLFMLLAVGSFRTALADWYDVPTGSMEPTIVVGDRIVVNKLAYDVRLPLVGTRLLTVGDPARGEIVICRSPADGTRLVKRVVAVPGDVIEMRQSRLLINGEPVAYRDAPPGAGRVLGEEAADRIFWIEDLTGREHVVAITPAQPALRDFGPVAVPEGRYFMMGDNRDNSGDSRHFGYVDRADISGRVLGIALSLDREHNWLPRWSRFASRLI
jgi:signal peptidase I